MHMQVGRKIAYSDPLVCALSPCRTSVANTGIDDDVGYVGGEVDEDVGESDGEDAALE